MAKVTDLLFVITSAQEMPFGITQYVQFILHGLTMSSFVFHSSLLTAKSVKFGVVYDGFLSDRNHPYFSQWPGGMFSTVVDSYSLCNGLSVADNEA